MSSSKGICFEQRDIALAADFRGAHYEPPQTVTAQERLQLMRDRATPAPQQHLRPKGIEHAHIQSDLEKLRERRINHIETRLKIAKLGMKRDRFKAANKDRAKTEFNKAWLKDLKNSKMPINPGHERTRQRERS